MSFQMNDGTKSKDEGSIKPMASSSSSADKGSSSAPLRTPKSSSSRRKTNKHLSAKQLDKIVKNLTSVQRSVGHFRSESIGSLSYIGETSNEPNIDDIVLDEDGQRVLAPYAITENDGEEDLLMSEGISKLDLNKLNGGSNEAEDWLRRRGLNDRRGLGKGPDGLALARIAAKGLKGKENAHPDSFMHEASFIFNPLNRRVPHQTPRKQPKPGLPKRASDLGETKAAPQKEAGDKLGRIASIDVHRMRMPSALDEQEMSAPVEPIAEAPKEIQEALILEDVLHVLSGIEGQYIHYAPTYSPDDLGSRLRGARYVVDDSLDASLRDLVGRILPLATSYTAVFTFVETESSLEFGTVVHALCAAIRHLLNEYEVLIVQLEHQMASSPAFTLQRLWFYVHPTLRTFSLLANFLQEIVEVSHENILHSDEEGDDEDSESSDDEDDDDFDDDSFEHKRRQLLGLDGDAEKDVDNIVKGGEVLSMLWDRVVTMRGDETAHKLFSTLLSRASKPYSRMLLRWITTGHLSDPYEEFLVMENPRVTHASLESDPTDEFWERRYTLRDETMLEQREHERQQGLNVDEMVDDNHGRSVLTGGAKIPAFLEPWKRKILLAGKYLNVIRECGKDVSAIQPIDVREEEDAVADVQEGSITDESFLQQIEAAYQRSNQALLSLLIDEHSIVQRLRSMKHYFFQSHSDFFSSFLEAAGRELRKEVVADKVRDVTVMRLQSHLGMVLGSSNCVGHVDPFREDLRIQVASENAYDQLKRIAEIKGGIEAARAQAKLARQKDKERIPLMELLQFDMTVKFPASLVISRKNILRWQFLQRPIIHLKATERALCDVWTEHQEMAWRRSEHGHPDLERWKMRIFRLRHRITFFVQQLLAFITEEVLEPNWRDLEVKMAQAITVDEFLKDHFDFLNLCRKECMLTDLRFVELLSKLMSVAVIFCENRVRFRDQLHMERANWQSKMLEIDHQMEPAKVSEEVMTFLAKIEGHWEKRMTTFKDIVTLLSTTDNPAALPLSYRLQSA